MRSVHAGLTMVCAIATTFLCVAFDNTHCHLWVLGSMVFVMLVLCKCPPKTLVAMCKIPLVFILLSCITVTVQVSTAEIANSVQILGLSFFVTPTSLTQGLTLASKACGATSCLFFFITSTPLPNMIATLRTWKCPPLLIELMYLIYRYLFVLLETQSAMTTAAQARLGYATYKRSWYTFTHMGGNVLIHAFKRSSACFDAMESRLYDGHINFYTKSIPLQPAHLLCCGGYLALVIAVGFWG